MCRTDIVLFGVISQALRIDGPAQGQRKRPGEPVTRGIAARDRRNEVAVNVTYFERLSLMLGLREAPNEVVRHRELSERQTVDSAF